MAEGPPTSIAPPSQTRDGARALTKSLGLAGSVGFIALLYWLFPEYRSGNSFYGRYWLALQVVLPVWAILAVPYIYWVDRRMPQPRDGLWQMGRLLLGRWRDVEARAVGQHLLGWLVKGFFLPLIPTYFPATTWAMCCSLTIGVWIASVLCTTGVISHSISWTWRWYR